MRILQKEDVELKIYEYDKDKLPWNIIDYSPASSTRETSYTGIWGAFDIETTPIEYRGEANAIMYIWQCTLGDSHYSFTCVGRTWIDYQDFVKNLNKRLQATLPMYVHNLGYEFEFLQSVVPIDKVFATKKHSPIDVTSGKIEYRCSYKLSNMPLARFVESENTLIRKADDFDYNVKRYPDTPLTDDELWYSVCDTISLHQAVGNILGEDTLATLPKTSTGFVRRDARKAVQANPNNRSLLLDSRLDAHQYKLCKAAARGGNTHANYLYIGEIVEDVKSKDKKSSYPYQMLSKKYPVGKLVLERGAQEVKEGYCNIILIEYINLMVRENVYFPYIAKNKCQKVYGRANLYNNGRVMYAGYALMAITEIDYAIIEEQYTYTDKHIHELYITDKDYLNKEYRQFIYEMFKQKCELEVGDRYYYNKYKNKINALFGMMLTDITREDIGYNNYEWTSDLRPVNELLNEYYNKYSSFLSYQQGIYVTAHARRELQDGFNLVGVDGVYGDTDSVKYMGDYEDEFNALNLQMITRDMELDVSTKYDNGIKSWILGQWEDDGAYSEFKTFGAKKYAVKKAGEKKEYEVTVAGLSKEKGTRYITLNGGLDAFKEGIIFNTDYSGRMTATYNVHEGITNIIYQGHPVELTSNVCLLPTTYTLGIGQEYASFLSEARGKNFEKRC